MFQLSNFLYKTEKPNHKNKEPTPPSMSSFPISLFPTFTKVKKKYQVFASHKLTKRVLKQQKSSL